MKRLNKHCSKPNILFIMTDQQKASATGIYGCPLDCSVFQDRMAREGITFTNAYANSPICTPSRTTIMTGVHPLVHQVFCHQNRAPVNLKQMPELLQSAGYYTCACGHIERHRCLDRGWHEAVGISEPGSIYDAWSHIVKHGRKDVGWSSGRIEIKPENGHAALLTDRSIRMLDMIKKSGMPYFLHVAYIEPHPPYYIYPPFDSMYDPDSINLPPFSEGPGKPKWQQKALAEFGTVDASEKDIRKVIAVYYGMISYVNSQMSRLYDEMEKRGLLENTWVILASDHGDYTGEKGMFCKTESLYECLLHVPLIIRPPDHINLKRGLRVDGLVELSDLFPTLLHLAGAKVPDYVMGHDLIKWVKKDPHRSIRDSVYSQVGDYHGYLKTTLPAGLPESGRRKGVVQGIRTIKYSYIQDPDWGDEAYDLQNDPCELNNLLAVSQELPDELAELKVRLSDWEKKCMKLRKKLGVIAGDRGFFWDE